MVSGPAASRGSLVAMQILRATVLLVVKNLPANAGDIRDMDTVPGLGRFPGEGNGNPLIFLPGKSQGHRSLVG